ncbi:putative serine protease [Rosellinia necatrix]|uniref:Putative serine protease n=1 Tax=Rosellinia necatrix TaxID=77044 RepID=A0A1W2TCA7_ROSNE|nr:putative serine protease [Rosellinia necatrix]
MNCYNELFTSEAWMIIQELRDCVKKISNQNELDAAPGTDPVASNLELVNYLDLFKAKLQMLLSLVILDRKYLEEDTSSPERPGAIAACLGTLCDHLENIANGSLTMPTNAPARETDSTSRYPNLATIIGCLKTVSGSYDIRTIFNLPTGKAARESYDAVRSCYVDLSRADRLPQSTHAVGFLHDEPLSNTLIGSQHREYAGKVFDIVLRQFRKCTNAPGFEHEVLVEAVGSTDESLAEPTKLDWFFMCPQIGKWKEIQCRPMPGNRRTRKKPATTSHDRTTAKRSQSESLHLCQELGESWWLNRRLRVQSDEEGFFLDVEDGIGSYDTLGRNLTGSETRSLDKLITKGAFKPIHPKNYKSHPYRFNHPEKRLLALKLASNILTFAGWKHTFKAWDSKHIRFFRAGDRKYDKTTALLTCFLGQDSKEFLDMSYVERPVIFTAFARLLLEIEYGTKFKVNLAERYQDGWNKLREFLCNAEQYGVPGNRQYLDAVAACLHFEVLYKHEYKIRNAAGRHEDGFVITRRLIRQKVLSKLLSHDVKSLSAVNNNRKRPANKPETEGDNFFALATEKTEPVPVNSLGNCTKRARWDNDRADQETLKAQGLYLDHAQDPGGNDVVSNFDMATQDTTNNSRSGIGDMVLASKELSPESWLGWIDRINDEITEYDAEQKVRIAVLDTGCDPKSSRAHWFKAKPEQTERVGNGNWRDFVGTAKQPVDDDQQGHGTSVVSLLLRTARCADVFVGRIAKSAQDLHLAGDKIAEAIEYAAREWDVDIVTMSFGFATRHEPIHMAIRAAEDVRGRRIIFFAAAANEGANRDEMFPAYLPAVISVRATDHFGSFASAFDPPPTVSNSSSPLYGTLGLNVPYSWPSPEVRSGCSMATPIMAGMVSLVFQLAACHGMDKGCQAKLRTLEGVQQLLADIAVRRGDNRYYVYLLRLFDGQRNWEMNWVQRIEVAMRKLPW